MSKHQTADVRGELEQELQSLQPAIDALDQEPALVEALKDASQAENDCRFGSNVPRYSNTPNQHLLELSRLTQEARGRLDKTRLDGADARRRANHIRALLGAVGQVEKLQTEANALRAAHKAAAEKVERASALASEIKDEIAVLEVERTRTIDQGVAERLDGHQDTSAKLLSKLDAEITIKRASLAGAGRALDSATADLKRIPEEIAKIESRQRAAMEFRGALEWLQYERQPELNSMLARYLASQAINFHGEDHVELRAQRDLLDEEVAKLDTELRGNEP